MGLKRASACLRCAGAITGRGRHCLCADCAQEWKWCERCHSVKPLSAFRLPRGKARIGYCYECYLRRDRDLYARPESGKRDYHYTYHLRRKFGISREEAERLAAVAACEVCGRGLANGDRRMQVDHDHATGRPRGVLCRRCNQAVAVLEGDAGWLRALEAYLSR